MSSPSRQESHPGAARRGFTLLELIVVIAIIATLASLVAPSVFRNAGDAKTVAARSQIEILGLALDTYRLDTGDYPTTEEGLEALVKAPVPSRGWRGPYLRKGLPLDPWGRAYLYARQETTGSEFTITTRGRDGREGGDGEDADVTSADSAQARR